MKTRFACFGLLALTLFCSIPVLAGESQDEFFARRFGLFIGANKGGPGRITLRYAQEDARAVKAVLEEMGGVLAEDSTLLIQPGREAFFLEMKDLGRRVMQAKSQFRRVEAIVYYSGHSDEESILLDGERVSYVEFREAVTSIAADVRIAILDSCASGSFTQAKGVRTRAPFLMDTAYDMKGYAFMTSSSADEASQESKRLRGSFFTRNLISGMRGAADMNLDGRITLTEAYQFAFDSTLEQTEKTTSGPQHPNYNIQMSGKGDVVITDISRSEELLLIKSDVGGKVYIHNRSNVLVVELNKPQGREVSIGLGEGDYRAILIADGTISEARFSLKPGKSQALGRERFERVEKIPTRARGDVLSPFLEFRGRRSGRWRIDIFGGAAGMNPSDLNLRTTIEEDLINFNLNTKYSYLRQIGEVTFFTSDIEGDLRPLRISIPWGFRLRRTLNDWLAVSVGLSGFWGSRVSSYKHSVSVVEAIGRQYIYFVNLTDFTLAAKGLVPAVGLHLGKNLNPRLRLEAHVGGGPVFAECRYSVSSEEAPTSDLGEYYETPYNGHLEEIGRGTGLALSAGASIFFSLGPRLGLFLDVGYAWQTITKVTGPGFNENNEGTLNWDDTWAIKFFSKDRDWGSLSFIYPSNYWPEEQDSNRVRPFKLDLSGTQVRIGFSYRL
jgi:hypothetical protein